MNILLTGANGKLGTEVARQLSGKHRVTGFGTSAKPGSDALCGYFQGDIRHIDDLQRAMKGVDILIHLAAIPVETWDWKEMHDVNVTGTLNALLAAKDNDVKRVLFASSICVYGAIYCNGRFNAAYFPVDEQHPCAPDFPYGISKLMGEQLCRAFAARYGINILSLRYGTIWFPDKKEHMARKFERLGDPAKNANHLWNYVDVRDAAAATVLAIKCKAENNYDTINIGAKDILGDIPSAELLNKYYPNVTYDPDAFKDAFEPLFSIKKMKSLIGHSPEYSWKEYLPGS